MIYREFQGKKLSALGMGMMRLPLLPGEAKEIDETAAAAMIDYALQHGINYFDTAYGYHHQESERFAGRVLSQYPRDSYYLASKFPGYDPSFAARPREIFEEQLQKCRTDHFDFYLFHNVNEKDIDTFLDNEHNGLISYLLEQKKNGRIGHLGFSCHGNMPVLRRFLDALDGQLEFCQLQLNYLDWSFQHGKEKVEELTRRGIPVWVMEPVRGGRLASLAPEHEARLKALRPEASPAEMAFRFLQSIPEVKMTLSGMSSMEQLQENIRTYETDAPLNAEEQQVMAQIAQEMISEKSVPCTGCAYCTGYCPQQLPIPELLSVYNEHCMGDAFLSTVHLAAFPEGKGPSACLKCHACEAVCPQNIPIPSLLNELTKL